MVSNVLSLVQKNIALSRALETQRASLDESGLSDSFDANESTDTNFDALLEQAMRETENAAKTKKAATAPVAVKTASIDRNSELYLQCQEFESIFVKQMLDSMNETVDKSGLLDNGLGQDIFKDMLYEEYAKSMTKTANFGIADSIYKQLAGLGPATIISR
jgi:Rod binding domain-containing protein